VKPAVALLAALLTAAALSSCGSVTPVDSTQSLQLLPSADVFTSSVVATRALGTAQLTVDVRTAAPSRHDERTAVGPSVISSGWGDLTWSTATGGYREMVNSRGTYVQADPPDGGWVQQPVGTPTSTSGFTDPLRGLGVLRDVSNEGSDQASGVTATRYTGWLPLDATEAALMGLAPQDVEALADGTREIVTAWVDDFGHVVRVDREVAGTGQPLVQSRTSMDDFSLSLDLTPPTGAVTASTTPQ
jgi:hypothetical protein